MSAIARGLRNPFRNRARSGLVVALLAAVIGVFAVMIQGALATRRQLETLQANVRTVIELREAGAFGTGGFGSDKPVGADDFSVAALDAVSRIPHAGHIRKVEEYVHAPQIDPSVPNAYSMIIGLRPGAPMRAVGEVDYENAVIVAGRGLAPSDDTAAVAVVGKLYALERLGAGDIAATGVLGATLTLAGSPLRVVGIYSTGNAFGDNHVFVPLETFRRTLKPGGKLSKIRVTVDSVDNVEAVTDDLKRLKGVDAVTAAEQVATARATLGSIMAATSYGSLLLFALGGVLVVFVMVLTTRERVREIGALKAIGASDVTVVVQLLAEAIGLTGFAAVGALGVAAAFGTLIAPILQVDVSLNRETFLLVAVGGFAFALLGSAYPIAAGIRLSPIEAMSGS